MLRILLGLLLKLCQVILSAFPISKKNHFVLGCSSGSTINGNAKALFFFSMNNPGVLACHLFLRNKALVKNLKAHYPDNVHYSYSFKALMLVLSSKALVITHGKYDLAPFICTKKNQHLINIWHGFPIKHLGIDHNSMTEKQRIETLGGFDGLVTMSEEERQIMSRAYKTKISNVWATGYPRNDEMIKPKGRLDTSLPYTKDKNVILYAPTYRDNGTTKLFPFKKFDLDEFDVFLERLNAIILLRVHKNELANHNLKETKNIRVCDAAVIPEMNDFLADISILVTDYSSIYIDILLIDKPMIFVPYDYSSFNDIRGFSFDYHAVTPGPKVAELADFKTQIERYLQDPSLEQKERASIRNRFHKYQDANSSKRVYEKLEQLVHHA